MIRPLLLLVTLLSLGLMQACAPTKITRGHHLEPADIERINVGVTTQQQVVQLLGSPSSIATFKGSLRYLVLHFKEDRTDYGAG